MTHIVAKARSVWTPELMVTGATVTENSSFSPLVVAIAINSAHCAYRQRVGQAELTWVTGYTLR